MITSTDRLTQIEELLNQGFANNVEEHQLGALLAEAFGLLEKGKFGKWVRDNLDMSEVKAYNLKWWYHHRDEQAKRIGELEDEVRRLKAQLADFKR